MSAEALDLTIPAPPELTGLPAPAGERLRPVPGAGPIPPVAPALTSVDLTGPGAGDELVARLETVLIELEGAAGHDPSGQSGQPELAGPDLVGPDPAVALRPEAEHLLRLFDAQAGSRWLDVAAYRLRAAGLTSALPGDTGLEAVAAVAIAARRTDPALVPGGWRAFHLTRGAQGRRTNALSSGVGAGLLDVARSLVGSVREPMSGSRSPAGGDPRLSMIPASSGAGHLPRAIGTAWAVARTESLPQELATPLPWPDDALVVTGIDGAAANHSTAAGAVNAACWSAYQGRPLPLLIVVTEGPRTPTPPGWVAAQFSGRAGLEYRFDDGTDPAALLRTAAEAAALARDRCVPVVLHLRYGETGGYRDPLDAVLRAVVADGVLTAEQARRRWTSIRDEVAACVEEALREPALAELDPDTVIEPGLTRRPEAVAARAATQPSAAARTLVFGPRLPEGEGGLTLAQVVGSTLLDAGAGTPGLVLLGESASRTGGPHGLTAGMKRWLGPSRVIDTVADERTVLGMALGAGVSGLLPVAEIRDLAALHTAADQLRAEAASLGFRSAGSHRNPLVIRVPTAPGEPGSDLAVAALREVPGLIVASLAHPSDAAAIIRTCLAAAQVDGTVSVVLEPVGLYAERDMVNPGDGAWLAPYHAPDVWGLAHVPVGMAGTWGDGTDLTIVTYGHALRRSLRVAARLAREGVGMRVVDLRWLAPLPVSDVLREAAATGRCLIVDEARRSGGIAEALVTALLEGGYTGRLARIGADDAFVPLGPAADLLLVSEADVEDAARAVLG